jgi:hypothetical protein
MNDDRPTREELEREELAEAYDALTPGQQQYAEDYLGGRTTIRDIESCWTALRKAMEMDR